jgi:hypothetical protein
VSLGEVPACVIASVHATQPLAVTQTGAREMHGDAGVLETLDGLGEKAVGVVVVGQ